MDDSNIFDKIHEVDLKNTMEKSYIDYAMSVIVSRALPDVRDGLKPVQRRILYSMIELNNGPDKPHRKCARIVGDTMGKYHPHGDSSIYGALVNLAQDWSTRYPLVDGHGNFGSIDGFQAAASRYTEAKMAKITVEMLRDIDKNTVDFFSDINDLKYAASPTFSNAINYVDDNAGWVRYQDVVDVINEDVERRNKANAELGERQQKMLENMKLMISQFGNRLTDLENNKLIIEEIPTVTNEDINKLFQDEKETLIIGNQEKYKSVVGQNDVGNISIESAFLLVYAAEGNGQIMKIQTIGTPTQVFTSGKNFMADYSKRESARWVEALDRLIEWGWVKDVSYKGEIFELTGTGYNKADWLKDGMKIDTSKDPLDELKKFED